MKGLVLVNGFYKANINYNGKQRRRSTRTSHEGTAERVARRMQARRDELLTGQTVLPPGVDPWDYIFEGVTTVPEVPSAKSPDNIDDFQKEYVASLGPPKISKVFAKTQAIYLAHFARFRAKTPDLPKAVKDWLPRHIEKYRLWRLSPKGRNSKGQKVRALTVHKEVASIRKMFDHARRLGLIEQNPVRDLEPIPDDAPDAVFRSTDEIAALEKAGHLDAKESALLRRKWLLGVLEVEELKALLWRNACRHYMKRPGDLALVMGVAGDAGLRLGEIGRLTTLDIALDLEKEEGIITARSRKQSRQVAAKERHVPIQGELVRRLASWLEGLSGRRLFHECTEEVFRADVYRALDAATTGTKFAGIRPHLLRHALRTNMYEAGVDEILIDAYLGHTTKEMGDHYRHIRAKRLADGARAYAQARARAATAVNDGGSGTAPAASTNPSTPSVPPERLPPTSFKHAMSG